MEDTLPNLPPSVYVPIATALCATIGALALGVAKLWAEVRRVQIMRAKERAAEADRYERLVQEMLENGEDRP